MASALCCYVCYVVYCVALRCVVLRREVLRCVVLCVALRCVVSSVLCLSFGMCSVVYVRVLLCCVVL